MNNQKSSCPFKKKKQKPKQQQLYSETACSSIQPLREFGHWSLTVSKNQAYSENVRHSFIKYQFKTQSCTYRETHNSQMTPSLKDDINTSLYWRLYLEPQVLHILVKCSTGELQSCRVVRFLVRDRLLNLVLNSFCSTGRTWTHILPSLRLSQAKLS